MDGMPPKKAKETVAVPPGSPVKSAPDGSGVPEPVPSATETDRMAKEIVAALGADLAATIATSDPNLWTTVSKTDLLAWAKEDVRAALAELAKTGWGEGV